MDDGDEIFEIKKKCISRTISKKKKESIEKVECKESLSMSEMRNVSLSLRKQCEYTRRYSPSVKAHLAI